MDRALRVLTLVLLSYTSFLYAAPYYGVTYYYAAIPKEPEHLRGYQFMLSYYPSQFYWRQLNLYFDGGYSFFHVPNAIHYSAMSIYSVAPILRFSLVNQRWAQIYIEFSIGVAYLNHTRMARRNQGIHFAFQDRIGIGTLLGPSKRFSLGIHAVHYSNAHLSCHNSGISVPLMLDVGYRFQ